MRDFAASDDPAVQAQLNRLAALSLPAGGPERRYGLETIRALLARLGDPQRCLPPTFHVAGTNGKGSTCAFLRACLDAAGYAVHTATKPHLVRYNERIRLAGRLIDDAALAVLLAEVLDAAAGLNASFFEVTTAATFLAFARTPADACIIEVGLGGRLDATNVLETPAVCGIAALGIDHEAFLLAPEEGTPPEPRERIAFEKAAIARGGAALVCQAYPPGAAREVATAAARVGAQLVMRGEHWWTEADDTNVHYRDAAGALAFPLPPLHGAHQADNAALAVAMLRHQTALPISAEAITDGIRNVCWPGRLQVLGHGPLTTRLPGRTVIIDGGHNADAAQAVAAAMRATAPLELIFGLMRNRAIEGVLSPLLPLARTAHFVPLAGHDCHDPHDLAAFVQTHSALRQCHPTSSLDEAIAKVAVEPDAASAVLIAGSLYLAGEVLKLNGEAPD